MSSSGDPIGAAFADYCRARELDVVLVTQQAQAQFWFEISGTPGARLRVARPGMPAPADAERLQGIWFRDLPDPPADLDEEDTLYAATEFSASLAAYFSITDVGCVGSRALTGAFEAGRTVHDVHGWCAQNGIAILPHAETSHLSAIPTAVAAVDDEADPDARRDPRPNGLYYVRLGNRRQLLAPDDDHREDLLLRAFGVAEHVGALLALDSGLIELAADDDAPLALGEISPHVPPALILRDPGWYFGAVLEALGV